jgi:Putative transposase, YhgA-like
MTDHDTLYHRLFSYPLLVEQLIRAFVPEAMAAGLLFERMERVNAKGHAEALDGEIHRREGDVIWRLPTEGGLDLFIYVLLEFQSRIDWWMAVRTQIYEGLLWQQLIAERNLKPGDKLPPVLMLVLYNGEARWNAPVATAELIALPAQSSLWPWQPQIRYHLLDMGVPAADLPAEPDSLAALLFRLEQNHPPQALTVLIGEVIDWFRRHPGHETLRQLFRELVVQAVAGLGMSVPIPTELTEMQTRLATIGERWKRDYLAEGRAEGEAKGKAEGEARGEIKGKAEALIRLAEQRFGPLPAALRARVLIADAGAIEAWLDRLLTATSLEMLFDTAK